VWEPEDFPYIRKSLVQRCGVRFDDEDAGFSRKPKRPRKTVLPFEIRCIEVKRFSIREATLGGCATDPFVATER
jgi:hypothetical protein